MAEAKQLPQTSWEEMVRIFGSEFGRNPRDFKRTLFEDPSPVSDMFGSSPILDAIRQALPEKLGDTKLGQGARSLLPDDPKKKSLADYSARAVEGLPLGGYSEPYLQELTKARAADSELRRLTSQLGTVADPRAPKGERPAATMREGAAQLAGITAGDLASEGLRNIWWFINAPQALASLAVLSAVHGASQEFRDDDPNLKGPLLRNRTMRLATAVPAVIATSIAIGNAGRQPGFKAVVPSESDPTVSADPLGEAVSRFFLGRSGSLLPYDEFVKERPDVSRSEYESYKAYLFGNAMPIKATMDGIQGPEVNFLGKSIPVATGLLPAVAAAVGAGVGIRKAGLRLRESGILEKAADTRQEFEAAKSFLNRVKNNPEATQREVRDAQIAKNMADAAYAPLQKQIDETMLRKSLGYSSAYLGAAALTGQTLESIRRALKGKAPAEDPEEEQSSLPALRQS
jgi:hypothetical protein